MVLCCNLFIVVLCRFFFYKQKTAYEMRISDWSSDVCSSDLRDHFDAAPECQARYATGGGCDEPLCRLWHLCRCVSFGDAVSQYPAVGERYRRDRKSVV